MILLGHKSTKYLWLYIQLSKIYFGGTPKYTHIWVTTHEEESKAFDDGYQFIRRDPTDGACLYSKKNCRVGSTTNRTRLNMTETHKIITPIYHLCKVGKSLYNLKLTSPRLVDPEKHVESVCSLVWSNASLSTSTITFNSRFCFFPFSFF